MHRYSSLAFALLGAVAACGGTGANVSSTGNPSFDITSDASPPTQGLVLWLRSDSGVTLASDGTVARWSDLSELGGRDVAPILGLPGPLYVPDAYGTIPALRGDGTPRAFFVNGGHGYPVGDQSTVFVIASASASGGTAGLSFVMESSQGRQYSLAQEPSGSIQWANETTPEALADGGAPANQPGVTEDVFEFTSSLPAPGLHVFAEAQRDGVSATGYFDGCEIAAFVPVGPSSYVMSLMGGPGDDFQTGVNDPIGLIISAGSFESAGDLVEVLQYDTELTAQEISSVYAYLAGRYGLSRCPSSAVNK